MVVYDSMRIRKTDESVSHLRPLETRDEANFGPSAVKMRSGIVRVTDMQGHFAAVGSDRRSMV